MIEEVVVVVEVLVSEHAFPDHLVGELALVVHHELEHLIVGLTCEHDLPCVELVDSAAHRPHVTVVVIP